MDTNKFYVIEGKINKIDSEKINYFISTYKSSSKINKLIESYLIMKYLESDSEMNTTHKSFIESLKKDIGTNSPKSFYKVNYNEIYSSYRDTFFSLGLFLKKFKAEDGKDFECYITNYNIQLLHKRSIREFAKLFPRLINKIFLQNPNNIVFFLGHQDANYLDSNNGFFKNINLTNNDLNKLAEQYCHLPNVNPNYLTAIVNYKKLSEYFFKDEIKLLAKKTENKFWQKTDNIHIGDLRYSQGIEFQDLTDDQIFQLESGVRSTKHIFNKKILDENHEPSTLLNNFIYFFDFFSYDTGIPWIRVNSTSLSLVDLFSPHSNADYTDMDFNLKNQYNLRFYAYYRYLTDIGVDLEELIAWYFNDYLKDELNINCFHFHNTNKDSSYYERGKSLISEFDSILDQFKLFRENGEIDHELLSIKSSSASYKELCSFSNKKFLNLIINGENSKIFSNLFSDQSVLNLVKSKPESNSFFELVINGISINEFETYQLPHIDVLIEKNIISIKNYILHFCNPTEIGILFRLWYYGTYCLFYRSTESQQASQNLINKNFCETTDSLFSKSEINYFSYILDDKQYGNSLKIRNRFSHGKYAFSNNDDIFNGYLELLQILILYTIRINDEFEYYLKNKAK